MQVFCETEIGYLGYIISPAGVEVNPAKLELLQNFPPPKTAKELKRFLGMCGRYRQNVPNQATIVKQLNMSLQRNQKFSWTHEQQNSFELVRKCKVEATALAFPDLEKQFILRTDASDVGNAEGNELPIAFASRTLSKTERAYHATEKKCLFMVWALKKFEDYLDGQKFSLLSIYFHPLLSD